MNTTAKIKAAAAVLASAATIGLLSAPSASAADTSELLKACKITENTSIQELAVDLTLDEGDVFQMINDFRAENGVAPVEFDRQVASAAVIASHDSILRGFTPSDHVDSLGRGPGERLADCGIHDVSWGEIAYPRIEEGESPQFEVSQSGAGAFEAWKNSPPHRAIMLDPKYTKVGIALGYNGEIGQVTDWNRVAWTADFTS
ncbi:MAG: CAP domain-containing protein [Nocardiaceae bacterium]|nr:CAP domain-containing protein [Nocardiaceae bacterium]